MTMHAGHCRNCGSRLQHLFADLGVSPLANSYLEPDDQHRMEPFYPLAVYVCDRCRLVQVVHSIEPEELFSNYAYFSSYSRSWLDHVKRYAHEMARRFNLGDSSLVVEVASNDGYLLQFFKERGIPVLGIEPAQNVARVAEEAGIPTVAKFFGRATALGLAAEGRHADLLLGNNVLAHVPDINDFVAGLKALLKPTGVITIEFPHLLQLMEHNQFDTIYHEHFSYLSFMVVENIFAGKGLTLFDVEELPTHGGSLRIYGRHSEDNTKPVTERVTGLRDRELEAGLTDTATYTRFAERVKATKRNLLEFLINIKREGKSIVGYGAPAKGNTLLNYCGIRRDFLDFTVDMSPHKQGRLLPGTHIPIFHPDKVKETSPDYVLILPWNIKDEIIGQMAHIREWGGKFIVPIPEIRVF